MEDNVQDKREILWKAHFVIKSEQRSQYLYEANEPGTTAFYWKIGCFILWWYYGYSQSEEEHAMHLQEVLTALQKNKMHVKLKSAASCQANCCSKDTW